MTKKVINKKYYELVKGDRVQFILGVLPDYTYECAFDHYKVETGEVLKGKVTIYFSDTEVNICVDKNADLEVVIEE